MVQEQVSDAGRVLAERGASKGGKARAQKMTPEERTESARQAALARWSGSIPKATHGDPDHPLKIGDTEIPCYVLDNGKRVLVQRSMVAALGMARGSSGGEGGDRLAKFATGKAIKPFLERNLGAVTEPIRFRTPNGNLAYGYDATVLADICEAVLKAREQGLLQPQQAHIAKQCEILVRGFARVGIIALVDEATGYQHYRARKALAEILEAFIQDELGKWAKRFPDEFYVELFRLKGLKWPFPKNPPQYVGHWTNNLVYRRLAPGVLDELRRKTPRDEKGRRKNRFHQWLTEDVGHPRLQEHLASVITLMKACDDWGTFMKLLDRSLPKHREMPLFDQVKENA